MAGVGAVGQPVVRQKGAKEREDDQKHVEKELKTGGREQVYIKGYGACWHEIIVARGQNSARCRIGLCG